MTLLREGEDTTQRRRTRYSEKGETLFREGGHATQTRGDTTQRRGRHYSEKKDTILREGGNTIQRRGTRYSNKG